MALVMKVLYAVIFSTVLAAGASPAGASPKEEAQKLARADEFKKPVILVAVKGLQGLYRETVLYAKPLVNAHLGFIVNRPSKLRLGTLFPNHGPSEKIKDPVYFGGPEMVEAIFVVTEGTERPHQTSLPFGENLFVTTRGNAVDAIIELAGNDAKKMTTTRFFAGFVGWRPNELEKEVKAGYWHVLDAPAPGFFFHEQGEGLWKILIEQIEMKEKGI
ncbi:MAG: YqgE/AlgH family protein [bacterium]|nr:YqgE/AlgH family protein [bacterium]